MRTNLLLLAALAATTGVAQKPMLTHMRVAPGPSSEVLNLPADEESETEVTMPKADPKVLTYISPDPFYIKTMSLIPAQNDKVTVMTRYNEMLLNRFKGNHAKRLTMAVPEEAVEATVFILNDNGAKVYEKEIEGLDELPGCDVWGVGYLWGHEINIDVDFEIDGQPFILGYEIKVADGSGVMGVPVIIQDVPTSNVSFVDQNIGMGIVPYYGAPYMMLYTEGDAGLADYDVALSSVANVRVAVNQEFNEQGAFVNLGTNPVKSIVFDYQNPDGSSGSYELTSEEPFGYMSTVTFSVPMAGNSVSSSVDCPVTVSKLDGNADANPSDNTSVVSVISMNAEDAPERTVVVEFSTGTWCGYCPRSLAAMEYLPEYTDTKHIPIEIHVNDQFQGENIDNYKPYVNAAPGLPYAWINRSIPCDPWQGLGADPLAFGLGDLVVLMGKSMVELSVDVKGEYDPETETITLDSNTIPAIDLPDVSRYKVGFALLENGLKGVQMNNYSNEVDFPLEYVPEGMKDWWDKPQFVEWEYNYTLRIISDANGSEPLGNGLVTANSPVANSYTFDASAVDDYSNAIAVAFVFDSLSGEIVNAAQSSITEAPNNNGVEKIQIRTSIADGFLSIEDEADVTVFDISGRTVLSKARTKGVDLSSLKGGVYLININSAGTQSTLKVAL